MIAVSSTCTEKRAFTNWKVYRALSIPTPHVPRDRWQTHNYFRLHLFRTLSVFDVQVPAIMEHSAAIMDDVGRQLDKGTTEISANKPEVSTETQATGGRHETEGRETNNYDTRKRKGNFQDHKFKHGAKHRGDGRGGDRSGDHKRHKKADMGRAEYL